MTTLGVVMLVSAIVLGVLLVIALVARYVGRAVRVNSRREIDAEFAESTVLRDDPLANYFGIQSRGATQMRGNGALVLTPEMLWFKRFRAAEAFDLPLAAVREVDTASSHLGKRVGKPLLRVTFETTDGPDVIAWYVRDAQGWVSAIEKARAARR